MDNVKNKKTFNIEDLRFTIYHVVAISFFLCSATYTGTRIYVLNEIGEIERKAERELRMSEDKRIEERLDKKTKRNADEIEERHKE